MFYFILKCFVLIDLKTSKLTHQDIGQMDMYVRMYDEIKKSPDDNPTLGVVMCTETALGISIHFPGNDLSVCLKSCGRKTMKIFIKKI